MTEFKSRSQMSVSGKTFYLLPALLAVWTLTTAGMCTTTRPPKVEVVEVKIPVAVPCDPKIGPEPDWTEVERAIRDGDAGEMLRQLYAAYKRARGFIAEQKAGLEGCSKPPD
jgi:hypothetical protein